MSGLAAARSLLAGGAEIVAWDDSEAARAAASAEDIPVRDLKSEDWRDFAALVLAPGIPLTHPKPHWSVEKARAAGVPVIGDTELFFLERIKQGNIGKVIVITGTNGKSTTTALTAHLLEQAGKRVALGGNIGKAVLGLPPLAADLTYILEFSSFQIDLTPSLSPDAAALLNITPDHLDRHGTLENYAAIKARIFDGLGSGGTAVIGVDDAPCRAIADRLKGPFAVKRVAVGHAVETGVWAKDGILHEVENGKDLAETNLAGIQSLRGAHNWQNAAAAYALARSQGLDAATIGKDMRSFAGLAHRMEQVGRLGPRALRQRLQGDQRRRERQGARKLRHDLLDYRRTRQRGWSRRARAILSEDRARLFDRRSGGCLRRTARFQHRPCSMRHARSGHRKSRGRRAWLESTRAGRLAVARLRFLRSIRQFC